MKLIGLLILFIIFYYIRRYNTILNANIRSYNYYIINCNMALSNIF